jgi:uncharacterized protein (TIGR02001 family)
LHQILVFLFLSISTLVFAQGAGGTNSTKPTFGMRGGAVLTTNFVEKGLTQTDGDPGLQGEFWFDFGSQFRLGLWGANVNYDSASSTHFWLKLNADIRVDFNPTSALVIKYSENKFYRSNNRDGNTVGFHLDFGGYKVLYELDSNWQGTQAKTTYAGLGKDFTVWGNWTWANQAGYTLPESDGVQSYFDIRSGIGKKLKDIFGMVSVSYTTARGDFKDQGELAIILSSGVSY